jgi:hypothetical protein
MIGRWLAGAFFGCEEAELLSMDGLPHRTVIDLFAASTIGAWVGLLIIASIRRARERKLVVSYINDLLLRLRR